MPATYATRLLGMRSDASPLRNSPPTSKIFPIRKGSITKTGRKRTGTGDSCDPIQTTPMPDPALVECAVETPTTVSDSTKIDNESPVDRALGLPIKFFKSIRDNLSRGASSLLPHSAASSRRLSSDDVQQQQQQQESPVPKTSFSTWNMSPSKKKLVMKQQDPVEGQFEVAFRISRHVADVFQGSQEAHPLFVGEKEPPITFLRYVERLIKLTNKWVEEADGPDSFGVRCAILAVEYIERVDVRLTCKSIHRYFMAAFLIGIKLLYDYYISNSFWAEVSGCPRKQVNLMEVHLCQALDWDFSVQGEKHDLSVKRFVRSAAVVV